jgi:hypothetical protein
MSSLSHPLNLGNAPAVLSEWLLAADYSQHCRERIVAHADFHGTLAGCPELDPEDEAVAEQVFVEALPAVPLTSHAWDDDTEWCLSAASHPTDDELAQLAAHGCV